VSGTTNRVNPWAACAFPASNPMAMNSQVKAKPNSAQSPKAANPSVTDPSRR
jgi:hypothetical protein